MKIIFMLFSLFLLLIFELWIGNIGFYLPLTWCGVFYFLVAGYSRNTLRGISIAGALTVDLLLYQRAYFPNLFICAAVFYLTSKYNEIWRLSAWRGGLFAPLILWSGYIILFISALPNTIFTWGMLTDLFAVPLALSPFIYLAMVLIIFILDYFQKKMKLDAPFVLKDNLNNGIYRKSTGELTK